MCGIAGIFNIQSQTPELRNKALRMAQKIRHRGPDWSGIYVGGSAILAHERLSIVDPQSGGQPLYSPDRKQVLAVNGEIYNHRDIRAKYAGKYNFQTGSDCEVILALYKDKGIHFLEDISGIFAFVLYDEEKDEFLIARDPIGVIPLYIGKDKEGKIYFGSELKALEGFCDEYEVFLPGHYFYSKEGKMKRWYSRDWTEYETVKENDAQTEDVKVALEEAVHRQLMSDVPYGVLLSGGDDYITKPFSLRELEARIVTNIKREERHQQKTEYRFMDEMLIDYSEKIVAIAGHKMEFTKIEYQIIEFLSMHPGQVFDKERIYEQVCGYDAEGDSRTITELVRRIRKKIADCSEKEYIETVWGIGYRWKK